MIPIFGIPNWINKALPALPTETNAVPVFLIHLGVGFFICFTPTFTAFTFFFISFAVIFLLKLCYF